MDNFGFNKLDPVKVNNDTPTETPMSLGVKRASSKKNGLKLWITTVLAIIVVIAVIGILSVFTIVLPAEKVYKQAKVTMAQAQLTYAAFKKENIALASTDLDQTRASLVMTQTELSGLGYLKFVPFVNLYYGDATHLLNAGSDGLDAAKTLIDSIKPYADLLGLKGQGSFVGETASQRIETAVQTMGAVTPYIDQIAVSLGAAQKEIDYVNASRYPGNIRTQLATLKSLVDEGSVFVNQARPLIKTLPSLLGATSEKKYLVIFQNDKELRPTGGFITAYAIFRIDDGVIHVDQSDDIYNLDAGIPDKPVAPAPILKYLANVPLFNIRDSNLSPDFITSMQTFRQMYAKARAYTKVDGIIAIDSNVLVSTIKILGDNISAGGITFTADNDLHCDCPQVIYQLESLISTPLSVDLKTTSLAAVQSGRKDILGALLYAIMDKALTSSPKLYWGSLFQDMVTETAQKHALFDFYDSNAQAGIEALNAAGRILPFNGDYLHINEANFGGAKSNMYVSEAVTQNYQKASDGTIVKTVTINYANPFAPSDCNLQLGALCLNAVLRDWIRLYVPEGSQMISSQGSEVKMTSYNELGKTVFEGFLTVRPKGTATFTISYSLPFKVTGSQLPLLIQKQPGTYNNAYTITVNNKTQSQFPLLTDQQVNIIF